MLEKVFSELNLVPDQPVIDYDKREKGTKASPDSIQIIVGWPKTGRMLEGD